MSFVKKEHFADLLHELGAGLLVDVLGHLLKLVAVVNLDLDEFMGQQRDGDVVHQVLRDPSLTNEHDGLEVMPEAAQVLALAPREVRAEASDEASRWCVHKDAREKLP